MPEVTACKMTDIFLLEYLLEKGEERNGFFKCKR